MPTKGIQSLSILKFNLTFSGHTDLKKIKGRSNLCIQLILLARNLGLSGKSDSSTCGKSSLHLNIVRCLGSLQFKKCQNQKYFSITFFHLVILSC